LAPGGSCESLWTPDGCVAEIAGILAAAGGGSVVGYSLGGRLALQLAVEHPNLVARAVIVSASPGIADEGARRARRGEDELRACRLEKQGLETFLDDWYRQPLFASLREHPRFLEVLERRRRNDPRLLARSLRTMGTGRQRSLWGDLDGLRTPLLFLAGERDPKFTALALDAVALCRHAEAAILRGRGHALVEEDPEAVVRETLRFLGESR
jgi:2-succinyl-6-hydroxy-2,4-cyclohexadiene-1-carboxylate synthase